MKHAQLILLLLFISGIATADSINTDATTYPNDSVIRITGESTAETVTIRAARLQQIIFERTAPVSNNAFSFEYPISFTDPTGDWQITLSDQNVSAYVTVTPTPDSATLVLTFLSPGAGRYERTTQIPVTIRLTKNNEPVTSALVQIFDPHGRRLTLDEAPNGHYETLFDIPIDARAGNWVIAAGASARVDDTLLGGRQTQTVEITPTTLTISVDPPLLNRMNIGETYPYAILVSYGNGQRAQPQTISASLAGQLIPVRSNDDGFEIELEFAPVQTGDHLLEIRAIDAFGNNGFLRHTIITDGVSNWLFTRYGPFLMAAIIILAIGVYLFWVKRGHTSRIKQLQATRDELKTELENITRQYIKQQHIPHHAFEERTSHIKTKIAGIETEIKQQQAATQNQKAVQKTTGGSL